MEYVTLSNGVKMPKLGYGVYQVSKDECERCVLDALKVGYRHIDTAQSYSNEEEVGNGDGSSLGGDTKTLVVYFSAQNHTERVAGYISKATGGDIFELVPVNPYSSADLNWTDTDSRVCREHDESLRDVKLMKNTVDYWDGYDTVFIGYPIWWGIAAWPVNDFIKNNDFTGKTAIPFCTSSSSPIGDSGTLLAETAGTGNWLTGQRFQSNATESTVVSWVNGLNLT